MLSADASGRLVPWHQKPAAHVFLGDGGGERDAFLSATLGFGKNAKKNMAKSRGSPLGAKETVAKAGLVSWNTTAAASAAGLGACLYLYGFHLTHGCGMLRRSIVSAVRTYVHREPRNLDVGSGFCPLVLP